MSASASVSPLPVSDEIAAFAGALADAGRAVIRPYFRSRLAVEDKSDTSPVTVADREAEAAMRRMIESRFPEHGIIGEEHGSVRTEAEYVWVLDPIDGTKAFVTGKPTFVTLIGLTHRGKPVLGVIDQAISNERWLGGRGRPSTHNGVAIRTRPCAALADAMLNATSSDMFRGANAQAFDRLKSRVKVTTYGGDGYSFGLIAFGFIDLGVEAGLKFYDYCAVAPIVEAAGGIATDWRGRALDAESDGRVCIAGDAHVHRAALDALAG